MLAVGVLAQGGHVRPDLGHQLLQLCGLRDIDHFLDHIVGILVLHHYVQGAIEEWVNAIKFHEGIVKTCQDSLVVEGADLIDESCTLSASGVGHALLHHVGGELVLGQHQDLAAYTVDQNGLVLLLTVFYNRKILKIVYRNPV